MIFAEESYLDLIQSVPHWLFEWSVEAVSAALSVFVLRPFVKRWIKQHDREHHHHVCTDCGSKAVRRISVDEEV